MAAPCGSTVIVYVPATGRVRVSTNAPVVANSVLGTNELPSGFASETYACVSVDGDTFRLMRWPAAPVKVNFAFCPGVDMLALADGPPGVSVPLTSGGTSYKRKVAEPVVEPGGSTTIEYVPVLGKARTSMNAVVPGPKNVLPPTGFPSGPTSEAVADENDTELIVPLTR